MKNKIKTFEELMDALGNLFEHGQLDFSSDIDHNYNDDDFMRMSYIIITPFGTIKFRGDYTGFGGGGGYCKCESTIPKIENEQNPQVILDAIKLLKR